MMNHSRITRRFILFLMAVIILSPCHLFKDSSAKARIRLSKSSRTYEMAGLWDKLTLKNTPPHAKVAWKSADSGIVKIKSRIKHGIWYQVLKNGQTKITASYKGKCYSCRITVKDNSVTPTPFPTSDVVAEPDKDDVSQSTTATGTPSASPAIAPSTVPTTTSQPSSPASDKQTRINTIIRDFKNRYITDSMSDYDKVDAVCHYLSYEYDYQSAQPDWDTMLLTGAGDCFASRVAVYYLCKDLGIRAYPCNSYEDHGGCMVRIDDSIHMTITGYGGEKPRKYSFFKMSEESIALKLAQYPHASGALGMNS